MAHQAPDATSMHRSASTNAFQVVVIGFGPAGAMAANLLGKAGIRTLCVDRTIEVYDKPRAIALDHEIMRLFDNIGLKDAISDYIAPFDLSEHFGASGQLLRRIGMVSSPYPLGYTPTMVFSQPPVEKALRERAASWPSVEVALGTEITGLTNFPSGVSLTLRAADGAERTVTADYVVACDGAASDTRGRLGLKLEDLNFDEPWVVVDIMINPDKLDRVPLNSAHFCLPERPAAYIVGPGNHRRWEIMLKEDENPRDIEKPEWVWKFLQPWITPDDATIWRSAGYRFHALVAKTWRKGRVFLAGDAAHQQPPILGQGMCQGMRDVANLCWKLEAVLKDGAGDTLLDTYGEERSEHVRNLITKIKEIGLVLCERDPARAMTRDERILAASNGVPQTLFRQSIIPPLQSGLIDTASGAGPGELFPQPWVDTAGKSGLLDIVAGVGWRLVINAPQFGKASSKLLDEASALGMKVVNLDPSAGPENGNAFHEKDGILARWFEAHGTGAAIVRPDHYVHSVALDEPAASQRLLSLRPFLGRNISGESYTMGRVA